MVMRGEADWAIATESLDQYPELLTLPGYSWHHCVIVPLKHPLLKQNGLTLEALAKYPLITYSPAFTGRSHIDQAFAAKGLKMDVVLTAIDADVIKTYVELGLGIGIIAAMAYDEKRDRGGLKAIDAGVLFRWLKRNALRRAWRLQQACGARSMRSSSSSHPTSRSPQIERARTQPAESYEL
jgi:LysR family cys regulon transcriptional activator